MILLRRRNIITHLAVSSLIVDQNFLGLYLDILIVLIILQRVQLLQLCELQLARSCYKFAIRELEYLWLFLSILQSFRTWMSLVSFFIVSV